MIQYIRTKVNRSEKEFWYLEVDTKKEKVIREIEFDKNGSITDINARAPHKKLQDEAIRVINLLPKMIPGRQRGRPVGVKYGLPIVFKVE